MSFLLKVGGIGLVLVGLLTWLLIRSFEPHDADLVEMRRALDTLALNDSLLHGNVLKARTGLLLDYDPLVRDVENMRASIVRLKTYDWDSPEPIRDIETAFAEEEELVETFKTDNALLQNSLAYFDLLSDRVARPGEDTRLVAAVNALESAVAHLAQDAGPDVARLVESRLDVLKQLQTSEPNLDNLAGLVSRGELLVEILPRLNRGLRRLIGTSTQRGRQAVRSAINAREILQESEAERFRVGLYVAALLLTGLLVGVGLRLRAGAVALRRRADLEHIIGLSSSQFIACQPEDIPSRIDVVLGMFGEQTRPDRAYVIRFEGRDVHVWSKPGVATPAGWPAVLLDHARSLADVPGTTFRTPYQEDELPPALRAALDRAGVRAWSGAKLMAGERMIGLLCFDHMGPRPAWLRETVGLLRMQGDVIGNALHREAMFNERRALETRLRQAQRLEAIGTFTSGVAHNFNNVIGSVLGHAEMAAEAVAPHSVAMRHVSEIAQAGERARELVGHILDFGRRGLAKQHLASLDVLLAETMEQLRPVMADNELVANGTVDGALVMAEPVQLQQMLVNLIRNAAQASPAGTCIAVTLDKPHLERRREVSHGSLDPGDYVRVTVVDQGRGMDPATLAKIFEPFFTTRAAGTGLGLATAFEVVSESGGAFDVRSAPDQGSTFEVWLPEAHRPETADAATSGPGQTVMVVGTSHDDVLGDEELLAALGFEPVGFADPNSALTALRTFPDRFDLAIADKALRGMSGFDFAKAVRASGSRSPVILSASAGDEIEAEDLRSAGVADVVRRPWRSGSLAATLTRNLKAG